MGLDATVYCNCYKAGKTKSAAPFGDLIEMDPDGSLFITTPDDDLYFAFERWKETACEHEDMVLIHRRIGNASTAGHVASCLKAIPHGKALFPVLLQKVFYSGTHAGDYLDIPEVSKLKEELRELRLHHFHTIEKDELLSRVITDLEAICDNSTQAGNPIVF